MVIRPLHELINDEQSAWPSVAALAAASPEHVRVLEARPQLAADTLLRLQVTTRSALGALAYHCGGLVIDHGWLRILGGGGHGLPDLATANGLGPPETTTGPPPFLVVAFDAIGGRFAVDGGGLGVRFGEVCYWGPDTLSWDGLGTGHGGFVEWALDPGCLDEFYSTLRWPGWEPEVEALSLDQGLAIYPPPFTAESRPGETHRRPVPLGQLLAYYDGWQLAGGEDGGDLLLRDRE